MNTEQKKRHDEAWKILDDLGANLGQKIKIRSAFASIREEEMPFIDVHYKNGQEIEYYSSKHLKIKNMMFETMEEVNLANAIFFAMNGKTFTINDFELIFKVTLRLLKFDSAWS